MHQPTNGLFSTSFPYRLWTLSWKLVLFVGLFLMLYLPFILPYFLFPDTEYATLAAASARAAIELLAMMCIILAALAMTRYVERMPLRCIGLNIEKSPIHFGAGALLGAGLVLSAIAILAVFGHVHSGNGNGPFDSGFVWALIAMFFNTIAQEVMVHGYIQQVVRKSFGAAPAVAISSLVLVFLHYTLIKVDAILLLVNLFAAGVLLGLAFLWSRSLWLPIGIHFGWNYVQGPILGLPVTSIDLWQSDLVHLSGNNLITGGSMGVEGGMVGSLVLVAGSALLYVFWRRALALEPELEHAFP